MIATGFKVLGLIVAGTGMGAVLAGFVDPVPRQPEARETLVSARPDFDGASSYQFVEVGPEDLSPPDSYAPAWAEGDESVWHYPQPAFAAWEPTRLPSVAELDAQLAEDAAILDAAAESADPAESALAPEPVFTPPPAPVPQPAEPRLAALY